MTIQLHRGRTQTIDSARLNRQSADRGQNVIEPLYPLNIGRRLFDFMAHNGCIYEVEVMAYLGNKRYCICTRTLSLWFLSFFFLFFLLFTLLLTVYRFSFIIEGSCKLQFNFRYGKYRN